MQLQKLFKVATILLIMVLAGIILVYAKPFLVPVAFAALLAMLLFPIVMWLKNKGVNETFSIVIAILLLVAFFGLFLGLVTWKVADLAENSQHIEKQLWQKYQQTQDKIISKLGLPEEKKKQLNKAESESTGSMTSILLKVVKGTGGFLTNTILVLVYTFLFICFRNYFKRFVLRWVPEEADAKAEKVLSNIQQVSQKYLAGKSMMIVLLWIMYGIGFNLAGAKNAFFFAILCGMFELVPFVGNILGTTLTVLATLAQGGDSTTIIFIILTYGLVQFIQSYFIEPLVFGAEVNINPLFTIMGLVAAEILWGVSGMVLAIPMLGIVKIVCDNVVVLKPFGELIGQDKKTTEKGLKAKVEHWVKGLVK